MGINIKKFFINAKGLKVQTMNVKESHRLFFFFLIGIIGGTLIFNFIGENLAGRIGIYSEYMVSEFNISSLTAFDKWDFFLYCTKEYIYQATMVIGLIAILKSKLINSILCVLKGCNIAFLVSSATISFGTGGLIIYIVTIFPHYFIYVPLFIFTLYFGSNIKVALNRKKYISGILKGIVIELGLIGGTAFLEAYVNLPLIINVFI